MWLKGSSPEVVLYCWDLQPLRRKSTQTSFGLVLQFIYLFCMYVYIGGVCTSVCMAGGEGINVPECSRKDRRELLTVNSSLPPWETQRLN